MKYDEVMKEGRIGTARYYDGCKANLKNFKSSLYFEDIDEIFLKQYQTSLLNRGNASSTVALRLRCLRIMYNYAVNKGFISNKNYPFKKFNMGSTAKSKKVLYPQQLKALYEYVPNIERGQGKGLFLFLFPVQWDEF